MTDSAAGDFPAFMAGGGTMGELIRAHDWTATPLGAPAQWPQSLRSALSICLHSSFPTAIYWGRELTLLYNDAWAPIPAERHPWALGRPGVEVWPDIWDVVGPQFTRVMASGEGFSTYDSMLRMVRGGVQRETYWNYSFTPIRGEDGSVVGIFNQGNETTAAVQARRQAEAEIDRLGRMFAQAPGAIAILRGPNHVFEIVNAAYLQLVGRTGLVGKSVAEALPEVASQGFIDLLDSVYRSGEAHVGRAVPLSIVPGDSGRSAEIFVDFVYQPLTDANGQRTGIFVQATDVTDATRAEAGRLMLLRELNHRVKNLFSIATGMVTMTARTAPSVQAMSEALKGRLTALAKAHEMIRGAILGEEAGLDAKTSLRPLIEEIVRPHLDERRGDQMTLTGPDIEVGTVAATSLALIFHELATNAAKYGALGDPDGQLAIAWGLEDGALHLDWKERVRSHRVSHPERQGFGSKLVRSSVAGQLAGAVTYDWNPDGVHVAITMPAHQLGR